MIRLIVLDLDQTVMGSDLTISPRVKTAIRQAQARGIVLTLATGAKPNWPPALPAS
jgi:hydroxymethylpyrimidine pyrophosphatase-like HAD family hydrolase